MDISLRELVEAVKDDPTHNSFDADDLLNVFGFHLFAGTLSDQAEDLLAEKIVYRWLEQWHCTDSMVGFRIYYFDASPLAASFQPGRKCDEEFQIICDEETYLKAHKFFTELLMPKPSYRGVQDPEWDKVVTFEDAEAFVPSVHEFVKRGEKNSNV